MLSVRLITSRFGKSILALLGAVILGAIPAVSRAASVVVPLLTHADTEFKPMGSKFTGLEGNKFIGTLASFTASPSSKASDFYAIITWGDGTKSTGTIVKDSAGHYRVTGVHTYAEEHKYITSVKITESKVGSVTTAGLGTIHDAPLVSTGITKLTTSKSFSGVIGMFVDTDPINTHPFDYQGTIKWGDGTTSNASFVRTGLGRWNILGSHKYAKPGKYIVTLMTRDLGGAPQISQTVTVTVK